MKKIFQNFIFLPIILIAAIAFVVFQVKSRAPIEHEEAGYPVKAVEVITAQKIPFRARAVAFGNVEPAVLLNVKSEVNGKVIYMHPNLKKGSSIQKGTVVLRIEPTTFNISLDQSKAGLAGSQSSLKQIEAEEKSAKRSMQIAQKNLGLGLAELKRVRSLVSTGVLPRNQLDMEEQKILQLRSSLQDIQGKLDSYSSKKASTRAQIKQSKSQVDQSKDTLIRTEVVLPFDARIGTVFIENGEYISAGSGELFEALGMERVEINAQIPVKQFRPLVSGLSDIGNAPFSLNNPAGVQDALSKMNLEARVRLVGDSIDAATWKGKLLRLGESVDPTRDTLSLVIAVDNPYEGIIPGKRPPLLKGMYTSIELLSPAKPRLVVPRKALHQGRVYVANEENMLEIQAVNILFMQDDMVVLDAEKDNALEGKKIIISDVIPVIQNMPLKPIVANEYERQLTQKALGKSALGPGQ